MFAENGPSFEARHFSRKLAAYMVIGGLSSAIYIALIPRSTGLQDPFLSFFYPGLAVVVLAADLVMAFLFFYFSWGGLYRFTEEGLKITPDNFGFFVSGAPKKALSLNSIQFLRTTPAGFGKIRLWLHFKGKQIPVVLGVFDVQAAEQHVGWFKSNGITIKET